MKRKIIALLFLLVGCTFLNAAPYSEKIWGTERNVY